MRAEQIHQGKNVLNMSYDQQVFAVSSGDSTLEQIIVGDLLNGNEKVIDKPYGINVLGHPITAYFCQNLAMARLISGKITNPYDLSDRIISRDVLMVPSLIETRIVQDMIKSYRSVIDKLNHILEIGPQNEEIEKNLNRLSAIISKGTRIRIPLAISFYQDYLKRFEKPENPRVNADFDMHRRIVDKSLQNTLGSSIQSIAGQIIAYENNPTLKNARIAEFLIIYHMRLGIEENPFHYVHDLSDMYLDLISRLEKKIVAKNISTREMDKRKPDSLWTIKGEMKEAYCSLINIDMMLNSYDDARQHLRCMSKMDWDIANVPALYRNIEHVFAKLIRLYEENNGSYEIIDPYSNTIILRQAKRNVSKGYDQNGSSILFGLFELYLRENRSQATSTIEKFAEFIDYSIHTYPQEIVYSIADKSLYRTIVFNQKPYINLIDGSELICGEDCFYSSQLMMGNMSRLQSKYLEIMIRVFGSSFQRLHMQLSKQYYGDNISQFLMNLHNDTNDKGRNLTQAYNDPLRGLPVSIIKNDKINGIRKCIQFSTIS